jgi:hypothetical protein
MVQVPLLFSIQIGRLEALENLMLGFVEDLERDNDGSAEFKVGRIGQWNDEAVTSSMEAIDSLAEDFKLQVRGFPEDTAFEKIRKSWSANRRHQRIEDIEREAEIVLDNIRESSGHASTVSLSDGFRVYAYREVCQVYLWTAFSLVALVATPFVGYKLLFGNADLTWQLELARLAITLPILAVAGYCAKVASHHRENARHAQWATVQLRSIRGYCDDLNADDNRELRMLLGRRVFANPDFETKSGGDSVTLLPGDVGDIIKRAMDVVRPADKA